MKIVVPIKLVPDLVEELIIDESGRALDPLELSLILNELDDQALEQAILLKEQYGAEVTVIAPDMDGADDVLYLAAARGADRLLRIAADFDAGMSNHALARMLRPVIAGIAPDLVLTGLQAPDDLDGQLGGLLAAYLDLPYVGYVAGLRVTNNTARFYKEYPGGLLGEYELVLPAVLGMQVATQPPRYIAFSRVRQARQTTTIADVSVAEPDHTGAPLVQHMYQPIFGRRATMIAGDADEVAGRLLAILDEEGYLPGG